MMKNCNKEKKILKWSFRPFFRKEKKLDNGLIMIPEDKYRIKLHYSKVLMHGSYYNCIKNKYGTKA